MRVRKASVLLLSALAATPTLPALAQFDPTVVPEGPPAGAAPPDGPDVTQQPLAPASPSQDDNAPAVVPGAMQDQQGDAQRQDLLPSGVSQQGLDALDPSSTGTLTAANGGLGADLWAGASRRTLTALLPQVPVATRSLAMRDLMRRLLLSEGRVPPAAENEDQYDVLQARAGRLAAAGFPGEIADLFSRVPDKIDNLKLTRTRVDALLVTGDTASACDEALSANQRAQEPNWLPVVGFCKAIQGDAAGAALATDMLRDVGTGDAAYFTLVDWLSKPADARGDKPELADVGTLTPLKLAMLKAAAVPVTTDSLADAAPLVLAEVAADKDQPADVRLAAAQKAAEAGVIDAATVADVYAQAPPNPPGSDDPVAAAADLSPAQAYALLYQAALAAPDDVARLKILQAVWQRAQADGLYLIEARVNGKATAMLDPTPKPPPPPAAPETDAAPPADQPAAEQAPAEAPPAGTPAAAEPAAPAAPVLTPELLAASPEIVRALAVAGEGDAARRWYDMLGARAAKAADQAGKDSAQATEAASPPDNADQQAASDAAEAAGAPDSGAATVDAAALQGRVWPYVLIADHALKCADEDIERWLDRPVAGDRNDAALQPVMYAVLDGFGCSIPPGFQTVMYAAAGRSQYELPSLAVWRGMEDAGRHGHKGEAVLFSLVALGEKGPAGASPAVLADTIAALRQAGLDGQARALAVEAMSAAGF